MPGLSASELHPASLYAGDTIEYYSMAFVAGDPRGHRTSVVLRVDEDVQAEYPISVDTGEVIPRDLMVKLSIDRFGNRFKPAYAIWRKLRSYTLIPGQCAAPTRSSAFSKALPVIIPTAIESAMRGGRAECEEIVPETSGDENDQDEVAMPDETGVAASSSSHVDGDGHLVGEDVDDDAKDRCACEEIYETPLPTDPTGDAPTNVDEITSSISHTDAQPCGAVENDRASAKEPTASEEIAAAAAVPDPTDQEVLDAEEYLRQIPNRLARAKIRHQAKKRAGSWHVPRSRKRRHQAKCAVTCSGAKLHHAHSVKAMKMKDILNIAGVRLRLHDLHDRRPVYKDPATEERVLSTELPWPKDIQYVTKCITNGVRFPDLGSIHKCRCIGDCFWDSCDNAEASVYCTPNCCNLSARCSNAPIVRKTLKLFDTGRVGLGVYTTTNLDVGDIVGEYTGELSEWSALVPGQPDQALKHNSGYTLLYNTKSTKKKFVYVDAANSGCITRFISHACDPNAVFVEMQNRRNVKVFVKMVKDVKAGAVITVQYGNERWFVCACDECWEGQAGKPGSK
ncbi:hypothetical protein F443_22031 [Phytophthora nicotianae P1569]|uniref:SET domain-containing protein n=1 Tax=Phytophthora nicotianae P1569 TaxID=1317065 RepID=V9DY43_PHYNI|nr:hypothetical protein F443_22031 [Phytophthora nicotianae P1569]